jgi:hypothetical protein
MPQTLVWYGGTGDWADGADWLVAGVPSDATPAEGDTVSIGAGAVTISPADSATFGTIDGETIYLGSANFAAPAMLATYDQTIGAGVVMGEAGDDLQAIWLAAGETNLLGALEVRGSGGNLVLSAATDGGAAGVFVIEAGGVLRVGAEDGVSFTAGTLDVEGSFIVHGQASLASGTSLAVASGTLQLTQDSNLAIDGSESGTITFAATDAVLQIATLAQFAGSFSNFIAGDTIALAGIVADSGTFDTRTDVLKLYDGTSAVGQLTFDNIFGAGDFAVTNDGSTTQISLAAPAIVKDVLPVTIFGTVGETISLASILTDAFGANAANFGTVYVSENDAATLAGNEWGYWTAQANLDQVAFWTVPQSGATLTEESALGAPVTDFSSAILTLGNAISPNADIKVPVAFQNGTASAYVEYTITVVDPALEGPAALALTEPTPAEIVNSASLFDATYGDGTIPDSEDCQSIAAAVAGAAGAVHGGNDVNPNTSSSETANLNQPDGFWNIAYEGDSINSVGASWFSELQPGDIVRLGWNNGAGGITSGHTTTVLSVSPNQETIELYDNADGGTIGIHKESTTGKVDWEESVNPDYVTVYQLRGDGRYLVNTETPGQIVYDTVYNDAVDLTGGPGDTIYGGAADELWGGPSANLQDLNVVGAHAGDFFIFTDATTLDPSYDSATGVLTVGYTLDTDVQGTDTIQLAPGLAAGFVAGASTDGPGQEVLLTPCYAAGTLIRTVTGEVPVEALAVGDRVISAFGGSAPVIWLGHRRVDCRRHPRPAEVNPVRVRQGAFGRGLPVRDLLLSPDHAVHVDEWLVPIGRLINGATIVQEPVDAVTYWHFELPAHGVIFAEGLAAESFLDTGNRGAFDNARVTDLHPRFGGEEEIWRDRGCASRLLDGPGLWAIRSRLAAIAAERGADCEREMSCHADSAGVAACIVPPDVTVVRLLSPAGHAPGDRRRLGVAVAGLVLAGERLALDEACCIRGFHPPEGAAERPWRWTDGEAVLRFAPAALPRLLEIEIVAAVRAAA